MNHPCHLGFPLRSDCELHTSFCNGAEDLHLKKVNDKNRTQVEVPVVEEVANEPKAIVWCCVSVSKAFGAVKIGVPPKLKMIWSGPPGGGDPRRPLPYTQKNCGG